MRWAGPYPLFLAEATGRTRRRRRRARVRRPLPRRHGSDGGARSRAGRPRRRRAGCGAGSPRCCRPRTRPGPARSSRGASGCRSGSSRSPRPTRTASRSGSAARSRGRPKILVFNDCYHGTVDETFATLRDDGSVGVRAGQRRPAGRPGADDEGRRVQRPRRARAAALAPGDVACVLAEPALTNIGIVLPEPAFHDALRELTRRTGTLLVIDETHTLQRRARRLHRRARARAGPAHDREGDRRRRPVGRVRRHRASSPGGSLRAGRCRLRGRRRRRRHARRQRALARRRARDARRGADRGGVRADDRRSRERFADGVADAIADAGLPWHVTAPGLPRRVPLRAASAAERRRGGGGGRRRARALHAPLRAQPRRADHALPQHGARCRRRRPRPTSTATPRSSQTAARQRCWR